MGSEAKDALTILRSIADTRMVSYVDEHTIIVRDTPENLALTSAVLKMADAAGDTAGEAPLPVSDGTVITAVTLRHASAIDVLKALRKEVQIRRIATLGEARVIFRDTESQTQAALEVIRRLEGLAMAPLLTELKNRRSVTFKGNEQLTPSWCSRGIH